MIIFISMICSELTLIVKLILIEQNVWLLLLKGIIIWDFNMVGQNYFLSLLLFLNKTIWTFTVAQKIQIMLHCL